MARQLRRRNHGHHPVPIVIELPKGSTNNYELARYKKLRRGELMPR